MAYHYIDSNTGTCVTDVSFASAQTGTYALIGASNVYASLTTCIANATLADGDVLCFASDHYETTVGAKIYTLGEVALYLISTDKDNAEDYLAGAILENTTTGGSDLSIINDDAVTVLKGITINAYDQFKISVDDSQLFFFDCLFKKIQTTNNTSIIAITSEGTIAHIIDSKIETPSSLSGNSVLSIGRGAELFIDNIATNNATFKFDMLINALDLGCNIYIDNTDFTDILNANNYIVGSFSAGDDNTDTHLNNCIIPSSIGLINNTSSDAPKTIATACGSGSEQDYYEYIYGLRGTVTKDSVEYLSLTYSTLISTLTLCNYGNELIHRLALLGSKDLSGAATVTINFTSSTQLYKDDIYFEIKRLNSASTTLGVTDTTRVDSIPGTAAAEHTTNTEAWEVAKTYKYESSISISGISGLDDTPLAIYVHTNIPDEDIWVDPAVVIT